MLDPARLAATTKGLIDAAPDRAPGSQDDEAAADFVAKRFDRLTVGQKADQTYSASGHDNLRNVLITLPGKSERTILVVAGRDATSAPAAASSASATGLLVELAELLAGADHQKTIVLASVDGSTEGASGLAALLDKLPQRDAIDAAVVLRQPGARDTRQPLVVSTSAAANSTSAQLVETARSIIRHETKIHSAGEGVFGDLTRLAFPTGIGDQAPLISDGIDAIALSGAGEPTLRPSHDGLGSLDTDRLADQGRAALAVLATLDASDALDHGPSTYVHLAGNLMPGWALAMLALILILVPGPTVLEELARAGRSGQARRALAWAVRWALPPVAGLMALYALALVGLIPRPAFPYEPASYGLGFGELARIVLLALVAGLAAWLERVWVSPSGVPRQALAAAAGAMALAGCLLAWFANPYMALLLAPLAHVWILAGRRSGAGRATALATVLAALPLLVALIELASALDWGFSAPWQLVLLVADGQIGIVSSLALALLAGAAIAGIAASRVSASEPPAQRLPGREGAAHESPDPKLGAAPSPSA